MLPSSSQAKHWLFRGETDVANHRTEANKNYVTKYRKRMTDREVASHFLTPTEERILSRQYEYVLKKFCDEFQPPMPKCVIGTSLAFFKRFYVYNSVMDYHPKDIMLTCVYLSCKVEEFYIPIGQFVKNLRGDREKFADAILSFELTLMSKLKYHLTVHNPFRPQEGFFIDIKTRCPEITNIEHYRNSADEFINKSLQSDAGLIFTPSQIALSAVRFAAALEGASIERYISDVLLNTATDKEGEDLFSQLKRIKHIVTKVTDPPPREQFQPILKKLEHCRNQENNPDSDVFKQRMLEILNEEDGVSSKKRAKMSESDPQQ